jgi:hypothetical protein
MVITMKRISLVHKQIFAALSLTSVFAVGCVSVDASVPEMQLVQSGLEFPGVPPQVVGEVSTSQSFSYTHDPIELPEGLDSKVRAVGVSLRASQGIEDFSFLRSMKIAISDEVNPSIELATFEHKAGTTDNTGEMLVMNLNREVDTLKLLKTESLGFVVNLSGELPKTNWSMDVLIDMSGKLGFTL